MKSIKKSKKILFLSFFAYICYYVYFYQIMLNLRTKFLMSFLCFTLITLLVGLAGLWFYQRTAKLAVITSQIDEALTRNFQLIKIEQDFFETEIFNAQFYRTGASTYLKNHIELMEQLKEKLYNLLKLDGIKELYANEAELTEEIKRIIHELEGYETAFQKLAALTQERGYWDNGVEGQMRQKIHALEDNPTTIRVDDILKLRRYEKDYLNRKDTSYVIALQDLVIKIKNTNTLTPTTNALLTDYLAKFKSLVTLDVQIGSSSTGGTRKQMRQYANKTALLMEKLVKSINAEVFKAEKFAFNVFLFITIFMLIVSVIASYVASTIITKPIKKLSNKIQIAIEKRFSKDIKLENPRSTDEIGKLNRDFNTMIIEIQQRLADVKAQKMDLLTQYDEVKEMNDKMQQSELRLTKISEVKDTFFSIISHDLRSPLNTLSGFLNLLDLQADAFTPEEIRNFSKDMQKSVERLLDLMENLMQWSRSQTQELQFHPITVDLSKIVSTNISLYEQIAKDKGINLISEIQTSTVVEADENMLNVIFRNLISNAIKFSYRGDKIVISTQKNKNSNRIQIKVADEGIGMTDEVREKVFKPEEHISTLGTNNEKGTGFGLSLCKNFVERHNGLLEIESQYEHGTVVKFSLNIAKNEIEESLV